MTTPQGHEGRWGTCFAGGGGRPPGNGRNSPSPSSTRLAHAARGRPASMASIFACVERLRQRRAARRAAVERLEQRRGVLVANRPAGADHCCAPGFEECAREAQDALRRSGWLPMPSDTPRARRCVPRGRAPRFRAPGAVRPRCRHPGDSRTADRSGCASSAIACAAKCRMS